VANDSHGNMSIAITRGYFNPLHVGHLELFTRMLGVASYVWVIVNNDWQAYQKRGVESYQNEADRVAIISQLRQVTRVFLSSDNDATVRTTLRELVHKARHESKINRIFFCKGGDSTQENIPELETCLDLGVPLVLGLGGKIRHSSKIVARELGR